MENREFGRMGRSVGVVGLGAWQLGADWGDVSESDAHETLQAAVDAGVTFIDTADVYGDGRSEQIIGSFIKGRPQLTVATKMGRRMAQEPGNYTSPTSARGPTGPGPTWASTRSTWCSCTARPPRSSRPARSTTRSTRLVEEKRISAYGVSVEKVDEALAAIARPGTASVQIILNAFRLKPLERVLPAAAEAGVGIIARVPLASGLLSGRYDEKTTFAADDHRTYNRQGEAFDVGETFSGVDFATGLEAVRRLRPLVPEGFTMAQFALRWVLDQAGVTVVIPGARKPRSGPGERGRGRVAAALRRGANGGPRRL